MLNTLLSVATLLVVSLSDSKTTGLSWNAVVKICPSPCPFITLMKSAGDLHNGTPAVNRRRIVTAVKKDWAWMGSVHIVAARAPGQTMAQSVCALAVLPFT